MLLFQKLVAELQEEGKHAIEAPTSPTIADIGPEGYQLGEYIHFQSILLYGNFYKALSRIESKDLICTVTFYSCPSTTCWPSDTDQKNFTDSKIFDKINPLH